MQWEEADTKGSLDHFAWQEIKGLILSAKWTSNSRTVETFNWCHASPSSPLSPACKTPFVQAAWYACLNGIRWWRGACNTAQQWRREALPQECKLLRNRTCNRCCTIALFYSLIPTGHSSGWAAAKREQERYSATGNLNTFIVLGTDVTFRTFEKCLTKINFP